jgi:putative transposase
MILHVLIAMVAGWIQDHQQQVITYLREENRILKAQLGGRRLRLTEPERRRLATLAHPLGRQRLKEMATLATPETLLRWYRKLVAQKFDGSCHRRPLGRPQTASKFPLRWWIINSTLSRRNQLDEPSGPYSGRIRRSM